MTRLAGTLFFSGLLLFTGFAGAQEQQQISRDKLEEGIEIRLTLPLPAGSLPRLLIRDAANQAIALKALDSAGRSIWLRRSAEAVTLAGTAHWMDGETGLQIDLRGLSASDGTLRLTIVLLDAKSNSYSLTIEQAESADETSAARQFIRTIEIGIK